MIENLQMIYFIGVNVLAFLVFGYDKQQARKKRWRVPEKTLFLLAMLGGSIGAWIGMQTFRHKTKHWTFRFGIPLIFAVQCAVIYFLKI